MNDTLFTLLAIAMLLTLVSLLVPAAERLRLPHTVLLASAGLDAPMGGNVGNSAAELVLNRCQAHQPLPSWLVVELSSYQIEAAAEVAPQIGIWTTLTPDHLERHVDCDRLLAIARAGGKAPSLRSG